MAKQKLSINELIELGIINIGAEFYKDYMGVRYIGRINSAKSFQIIEPKGFDITEFYSFNEPIGRIVGYPVNAWKWWQYIDADGITYYINEWWNKYKRLIGDI